MVQIPIANLLWLTKCKHNVEKSRNTAYRSGSRPCIWCLLYISLFTTKVVQYMQKYKYKYKKTDREVIDRLRQHGHDYWNKQRIAIYDANKDVREWFKTNFSFLKIRTKVSKKLLLAISISWSHIDWLYNAKPVVE